jgi:hypothetical protein
VLRLSPMGRSSVVVHVHDKASGKEWYVIPAGPVPDETAEKLKKRPDIIGQKDGPGPGHNQTMADCEG